MSLYTWSYKRLGRRSVCFATHFQIVAKHVHMPTLFLLIHLFTQPKSHQTLIPPLLSILSPSVPALFSHPSFSLRPSALLNIHSLAVTSSSSSSPPCTRLFSTTSSSGRQKYTRLYLVTLPCSPGGATTRWILDLRMPDENLTNASPRLTIQWPGSGRTYVHPFSHSLVSTAVGGGVVDVGGVGAIESGKRTCRPPSLLKRTVTLPKSVCSPSATPLRDCSCGGALTKRIWSPDVAWRRCRACRPPFERAESVSGRREETSEVMSMQMAWEDCE